MSNEDTITKLPAGDSGLKDDLEAYTKFVRSLTRAMFSPTDKGVKIPNLRSGDRTSSRVSKARLQDSQIENRLELGLRLAKILDSLADHERRIFQMVFWYEMGNKEASEKLGISEVTFRQAKCRVVNKIRSLLEESESEESRVITQTNRETELINKINSLFSAQKRKRYDELYARFQRGKLIDKEHDELVKLSDEFENLNAERLKYLGKLADLRGISLAEAIKYVEN